MTGIVAIDESGDLGRNGSRFYVISAVMSKCSRNLRNTAKMIDNSSYEGKYRNTTKEEISKLLMTLAESDPTITYVVADKYDYESRYYDIYGNALYRKTIEDLFDLIDSLSPANEVKVMVDSTFSISQTDLEKICKKLKKINVVQQTKINSSSNKCIQIADYVAGTIWHKYERNECEHYKIIEKSIRRP